MSVWTVFFLVLSAVILASAFLPGREDPREHHVAEGEDLRDNTELELDVASGRLLQEDFETMTGKGRAPGPAPDTAGEGDHGTFPQG